MNALDFLKDEHEELKQKIKRLEKASGKTKLKLFEEIKLNATIHEKAETKFLYSYLMTKKKYKNHALEHDEEVKIMSRLLRELNSLTLFSDEWKAKFEVFKELTEHHIEEEENEVFPDLSSLLSHDILDEIGCQILDYKTKYMARKLSKK